MMFCANLKDTLFYITQPVRSLKGLKALAEDIELDQ